MPVQLDDHLLKDPHGRVTGIRATLQDITERKRIEWLEQARYGAESVRQIRIPRQHEP